MKCAPGMVRWEVSSRTILSQIRGAGRVPSAHDRRHLPAPRSPGHLPQHSGLAAGGGPALSPQQPRPGGGRGPRAPCGLWGEGQGGPLGGGTDRHRPHPGAAPERPHPAGAVRQAGGRIPHPRHGPPGADRQFVAGAPLGDPRALLGTGGGRADDVRADDGRLVDLHRHPGHPPGHLPDLRRHRRQALRRQPGRDHHPDRRPGGHGRRPAAGGDDERRGGDLRRGRSRANPPPPRDRLPGRAGGGPRRRHRPGSGRPRREASAVDRRAGQRRRGVPRSPTT
jgi:hypothetical protein